MDINKRKERTKNKTLIKITLLKKDPLKQQWKLFQRLQFQGTVTWPERAKEENDDGGNSYREMRAVKWTEVCVRESWESFSKQRRWRSNGRTLGWMSWDNVWWLSINIEASFSWSSTIKQKHTRDLCKRERDCVCARERERINNTLNGWPNFQIKRIIKR
jgi:hypothetical protein